jgi:hypothetical protein
VDRTNPTKNRPPKPAKAKPAPKAKSKRQRDEHWGKPRTIDGESRTLREWADHLGITLNLLHQRMHKLGSLEAAIAKGSSKRAPIKEPQLA